MTAKTERNRPATGPIAVLALEALDIASADVDAVEEALADVGRARSWLTRVEADLMARSDTLAARGSGAGGRETVRTKGNRSSREAGKAAERSAAIGANPGLGDALDDGDISEDHIDALTRAGKDLDDDKRGELFNDPDITDAARRMAPEPFNTFARQRARKLADDEGEDKLQKQKNATRLRAWVRGDGMHIINGEFDAETGAHVFRAIDAELETLAQRDRAPKNDRTRAAALAVLVSRGLDAGPSGTPAEVVVIDVGTLTDGLHDHSICETSSGVELPPETIRRIACSSIIMPTIISGSDGQVLFAGRSVRVASRAQRRSLRAMYATCAFDTCHVAFDHCQIHHVVPWHDGGPTDLDNLLPLCSRHHHLVHEGRWDIRLEPDRSLAIYEPSGRHFKTVPLPSRDLAAGLASPSGADAEGPAPPCRPAHNRAA